jgi:hypothetical protein
MKTMSAILGALGIALLLWPPSASAGRATVTAYTYRGDDASRPVIRFAPHDPISLRVRIKQLPAGEYALLAEWSTPLREMAEATAHTIECFQAEGDLAADFAFSLVRSGFWARMLTRTDAQGFDVRYYGNWRVRVYLDGEEIVYKDFEIR